MQKESILSRYTKAVVQISTFQKDAMDQMMKAMNNSFSENSALKLFGFDSREKSSVARDFSEFMAVSKNMVNDMADISNVIIPQILDPDALVSGYTQLCQGDYQAWLNKERYENVLPGMISFMDYYRSTTRDLIMELIQLSGLSLDTGEDDVDNDSNAEKNESKENNSKASKAQSEKRKAA